VDVHKTFNLTIVSDRLVEQFQFLVTAQHYKDLLVLGVWLSHIYV